MDKRIMARFALRESMGILFTGIILFWSAGTIRWWPGWALVALDSAWIIATGTVVLRNHPDLLAERLGPRQGAKRWDTVLMSGHGLLQIAVLIVAGLDHRYGWTAALPASAQVAALLVSALGYALVVWATASNPFFSLIVRIQTERGHSVIAAGPYAHVRHPAYAGGVLTNVFTPILLGSAWALLIGSIDALLMILRTALEDRALRAELPGYPEYALRVRYRLLPHIW